MSWIFLLSAFLGLAVTIALLLGIKQAKDGFKPQSEDISFRLETQKTRLSDLGSALARERDLLVTEHNSLQSHIVFLTLSQKYFESQKLRVEWQRRLDEVERIHQDFKRKIDSLKSSRRYHVGRWVDPQEKAQEYHACFALSLTSSLDDLHATLEQIEIEIHKIHTEMDKQDRNAKHLRDYISIACGNEGRKWQESLDDYVGPRKALEYRPRKQITRGS